MQRDLLQNHKNILSTITRHTVYLTLIFMPYTFFQCMKAYRNSKSHIFVLAPALKCVYTTQIEAKDVHKGLISVADRNIRGADCGESSHGDVVLGPLEIRAHVESRHHTYTHTHKSYCENKTGDKGPFKTWRTERHTYQSSLETPSWLQTGAKNKLWSRQIRASFCAK